MSRLANTFTITNRGRFVTAASMIALMSAMPSIARAAEAQEAQGDVQEIIVTGSRIVRNGYEAPTPVTVVGIEQLQESAKPNIADALNEMPVFQGSTTPASSGTGNGGTSGGNNINLRNLNANRTLVLFDGRRIPPAQADGTVDINLLPDGLVSRVDVVTGGASAVYGSDALVGVVNFVLDTTFTGIKGNVQGGVTDKGDGRNYKVSLAYGTNFANDRGHFILAADNAHQDAIDGEARAWNQEGWYFIQNPARTATNLGAPQFILSDRVGLTGGYPGGIITAGVLKGVAFGPGGTPFNYNYGEAVAGQYQIGGDWRLSSQQGAQSIMIKSNSTHLFSDVRYDITDDIQVYAQFNNAGVKTNARCCYVYYLTGNLPVHADNPYLPASLLAAAQTYAGNSIPFSKTFRDDPHGFGMINDRIADTYSFGAKGKLDAFEKSWSWNVYAQRGISKQDFWVPYQAEVAKLMASIDAVRAPNGSIVCRVNSDTNPANDMPGCIPYNVFGVGVNTRAAFDYFMDGPRLHQTLAQNVAGGSFTGEPFSTWAGPVSLAVSGEYRKDTIRGSNDAISPNIGWFSTQLTGFNASQSVVEGALETVVPLAKDETWARALDLNAAVRFTDYSVSGFVTTWKVGATYTPIDDVRFRVTQSRDIRAPNLQDLFSAPVVNHNTIPDPFRQNLSFGYYQITQGNTNLVPEKGDTTGVGVVYQPSWFSGFSASIDFYRINLKGAIASVDYSYVINQCFAGVTAYCSQVKRLPLTAAQIAAGQTLGDLDSITRGPQNQASLLAQGVDYEASYQTALSDLYAPLNGNLNIRLVATNVLNRITDSGIAGPTQVLDAAGTGSTPRWGVNSSITYSLDAFRVNWTGRYISRGRYGNTYLECTSNCPSISGFQTVNKNYQPPYFVQNMSVTYRFYQEGQNNAEMYFAVDNLMDRDPPPAPNQFAGATYGLETNAMYDTLGRRFRAGIRFKM